MIAMKTRTLCTVTWALLAVAASAAIGTPLSHAAAPRPNIVFIMADDLGIGDLGVTGQLARAAANLPAIATPNIDQLASQGTMFTQMYAGAPICSPSRTSLLTGFETQHIIRETVTEEERLRSGAIEDRTFGQVLQDAGYATGMWGKWHVGGVGNSINGSITDFGAIPTQKGFETAYGTMLGGYRPALLWENDGQGGMVKVPGNYLPGQWAGPGQSYEYSEDITTRHAVDYIRDKAGQDQPFGMYYAFHAPHTPLNWYGQNEYAGEPWPDVSKHYASMVSQLDRHVGMMIDALEDPNNDGDTSDSVMDNTLLIFTSDNGPLWDEGTAGFLTEFFDSNGDYRGQKTSLHEAGSLVPFIARWDGVLQAGGVNSSFAGSFADMLPTFAELAGVEAPVGIDGISMASVLLGEDSAPRSDAQLWSSYVNFRGLDQAGYAVRLGDWKLIHHRDSHIDELFNLGADPYEATNLSGSRSDIVAALKAVAAAEGMLEEPMFGTDNAKAPINTYFAQYKNWVPNGDTNFNTAVNWTGGTQFNATSSPESLYWNTGPANNWVAHVDNTLDGTRNAWVTADADVLAMEIVGSAGTMAVHVSPGRTLSAYNGVRVKDRGALRLVGDATLRVARNVEIQQGGRLVGAGTITGWQELIDGIAEFADQGLLQPTVINSGAIEIYAGTSPAALGTMVIEGDYQQTEHGVLQVDLQGTANDLLVVEGQAKVAGSIAVASGPGAALPVAGTQHTVLVAAEVVDAGFGLSGPDGRLFGASVVNNDQLVLTALAIQPDFSHDGLVDAADLGIWQSNYGQGGPAGDADADAAVSGLDFLIWQTVVGRTVATSVATVPEPAAAALAVAGMIAAAAARRRRQTRS
ncbi:MAG: hypothetical protein CMJ58_22205 [Planctomycetaceae bacterium]|nr:hypothetical protein [Planctomycetaceae bacterium]